MRLTRIIPVVAVLAASLAGAPVASAAITVTATSIRSGAVHGSDVTLTLRADGDRTALDLRAKRVQADGWTAPYTSLRLRCALVRDVDGHWSCDGDARAKRDNASLAGQLAIASRADGSWQVALRDGGASLAVAGDTGPSTTVTAQAMPLTWIADVLKTLMPNYAVGGGALDARIALRDDAGALRTDGDWTLRDLALDSSDGEIGAAGVEATGTIAAHWPDLAATVALRASLARGGVLVSPLYAEVGATPVRIDVDLAQHRDGWTVPRWQLDDPGAISGEGTAELSADGTVRALAATRFALTLPAAFDRYLSSLVASTSFAKLAMTGSVDGTLAWSATVPLRGDVRADIASLGDDAGRIAATALRADLHLGAADVAPSTLSWRGGSLYGIPFGAAQARLAFADGGVRLLAPLPIDLLGGRLTLSRFARARGADGVATAEAALAMENLSVEQLSQVFDWPAFGGTLSGTIPAVRGVGDRYTVDGTLALDVFDGKVAIGGLALERPFGVAPSLVADVAIDDLDLGLVTRAFSFGSIEGRLDGRIGKLRVVDWTPVAFDAHLRTDKQRGGKQRLSQRAVNSLSSVGGGGAGVQASLLRMFEHFGYDAIGLDLALANNVVTLGGLDDADGGYTIVRGSGLPRLSVVGHQRRVDWQVLVARLKAATTGTSPVIK